MSIIESVVCSVLGALYSSFLSSLWMAFLEMGLYMFVWYGTESGKGILYFLKAWTVSFKTSKIFRKYFLLCFFFNMILFQTLFSRNLWGNPLLDVFGGWWIWELDNSSGNYNLNTDCMENVLLFIPFIWILVSTKLKKIKTKLMCFCLAVEVSCSFSIIIEICQLIFKLGTFQFSDIVYNTLGGILGCSSYIIYDCISSKIKKRLL